MSTPKDRRAVIASAASQPPSHLISTATRWFTEGHAADARKLLNLIPENQLNRADVNRFTELSQTMGQPRTGQRAHA